MKRAPETLSARALNRALLERQLLSRRQAMPVTAAVEHLVGMQAQMPNSPYVGLWTRLEGFAPAALGDALLARKVVRTVLMRSTIHLVTARDARALRPVLTEALERSLFKGSPFGRALAGLDVVELVAAGRALLEDEPRTTAAVGKALEARWPERDPVALGNAIRTLVPLVQVPPRGVWGSSGQPVCATAERWLGRPMGSSASPDRMILRYLAAFGPASLRDVQLWSGMARLRDAVERLRPRLRGSRDERGVELVDVEGAPLPDPETPAAPRFLPDFDNVLLGHADRSRIVPERHRPRLFGAGTMRPTFLVDGFVAGNWTIAHKCKTATLTVAPFEPLPKRVAAACAREGEALLAFAAADADIRRVEFA